MTPEDRRLLQEEERQKQAARARRQINHCHRCGGTMSVETPHPLGGNLIVLQCPGCGNDGTFCRKNGRVCRVGRR